MPTNKFYMTNTELKLKRERMMAAFLAGKTALEELRLPYFLSYGSALGALREGQFQPYEDHINVGIYSWDLAGIQRQCTSCTARERDMKLKRTFDRCGFEPVSELIESPAQAGNDGQPPTLSACPRVFMAEGWTEEMAFPILFKFTHRESFVRFDVIVFTMQFGQLWDFADGGAETSSGWRYTPFSPQPIEFEKSMTCTMPAEALAQHYGKDWHVPQSNNYIQSLSRCENRCQVLRVHPFDSKMSSQQHLLPKAKPWEEFRVCVRECRINYAKAMADSPYEFAPKPPDLYKIESKPVVLFQAAGICKQEGNERLQKGNPFGALDKYDEGLYIMDKCREVLTTWRLIFRQIHNEKAEKDRKDRGLKVADLQEPDMPREFRADEDEERSLRIALLLNAAQAASQAHNWDIAESRSSTVLELDPKNCKALYRRGVARVNGGKLDNARSDFWSMLKASNFESKEALSQLLKLMPKDEVYEQVRRLRRVAEKENKLGSMLTELEEDDRISLQDERYQRYLADCEQRRRDKQREISFDDWVRQYEWRYDADERAKVRSTWPECFSHQGPAPLPVEEWEVDYLTQKEVDKIMYRRQTQLLGERRRQQRGTQEVHKGVGREDGIAGPQSRGAMSNSTCRLEVDKEDEPTLRDAVVRRGYNYWW